MPPHAHASTETFQGDSIKRIYGVVDRSAIIDFHLMYMNPEKAIEKIDGIVNPSGRSNVNITVHREAYCDDICDKNAFAAELNGALLGKNGSRKELEKATKRLSKTIAYLKDAGYSVGMAFEPETGIFTLDDTLIGLSDETIGKLDLLLPMTVVSGKGGQVYMDDLGWKIEAASDKYDGRAMSGKKIQVDGGIKDRNIYHPLSMGARDLVIGSYVTRPFLNGEENPGANMLRISNLINQFNGTTTYS